MSQSFMKKCPSCGKERCPGIVMRLDCPALKVGAVRVNPNVTVIVPLDKLAGSNVVTKVVTHHRGQGWRLLGDKPMTPAERQRRHRQEARDEQGNNGQVSG